MDCTHGEILAMSFLHLQILAQTRRRGTYPLNPKAVPQSEKHRFIGNPPFRPPGAKYERNSFISLIFHRVSIIYLCKSSGSSLLVEEMLFGYLDLGKSPSQLLLTGSLDDCIGTFGIFGIRRPIPPCFLLI